MLVYLNNTDLICIALVSLQPLVSMVRQHYFIAPIGNEILMVIWLLWSLLFIDTNHEFLIFGSLELPGTYKGTPTGVEIGSSSLFSINWSRRWDVSDKSSFNIFESECCKILNYNE